MPDAGCPSSPSSASGSTFEGRSIGPKYRPEVSARSIGLKTLCRIPYSFHLSQHHHFIPYYVIQLNGERMKQHLAIGIAFNIVSSFVQLFNDRLLLLDTGNLI
jgi:hypothetical protein